MGLDATDVIFFNVDFQASFFTLLFHPQSRGSLAPVATTGLSEDQKTLSLEKVLLLPCSFQVFIPPGVLYLSCFPVLS